MDMEICGLSLSRSILKGIFLVSWQVSAQCIFCQKVDFMSCNSSLPGVLFLKLSIYSWRAFHQMLAGIASFVLFKLLNWIPGSINKVLTKVCLSESCRYYVAAVCQWNTWCWVQLNVYCSEEPLLSSAIPACVGLLSRHMVHIA